MAPPVAAAPRAPQQPLIVAGRRGRSDPIADGTRRRFLTDSRGSTAIEYSLIAALIILAIIGALSAFADRTQVMYKLIETKVGQAP